LETGVWEFGYRPIVGLLDKRCWRWLDHKVSD